MKHIVLLIGVFSVVVSGKICFNKAYEDKMDKIIEECQKNPATQASEAWLKSEDLTENLEGEGSHIFCRLKAVGSLKENGDVDAEAMEKDISSGIKDKKIVKTIVEKCGTRAPGTSPEKSAIDNFRCVLQNFAELSKNAGACS